MIPVLPRALPTLVPVQVAAPAPVMSRKSTLVRLVVAAVMVRAVPRVVDWQMIRFVALFPVTENAAEQVNAPENVTAVVFDVVFVIVSEMTDPVTEVTAPELVSITASSDAPGAVCSMGLAMRLA